MWKVTPSLHAQKTISKSSDPGWISSKTMNLQTGLMGPNYLDYQSKTNLWWRSCRFWFFMTVRKESFSIRAFSMMETEVSITGPIHFYGIFPHQEYFSKKICFDRYDSYPSTIGVCVIILTIEVDKNRWQPFVRLSG